MTLARPFRFLIDFIFPPACHACNGHLKDSSLPVCAACLASLETLRDMRVVYPAGESPFTEAVAVWNFDDKLKAMVHLLKYDHKESVGRELGRRMGLALNREWFTGIDLVTPVPIHHTRRRERGYNQAEIIGREVAAWLEKPLAPGLLKRLRSTGTQTQLDREARSKNMAGAFAVAGEVKGRGILLVDDVFTTGATLSECAGTLVSAGAKEVRVLTAARVV